MFRKVCITLINGFLHCIFRVKVEGKENVPCNTGAILAVNHRSNWDVLFAGTTSPRPLTFMAKSELFKNPLFGGLIKKLGAFPVKRGKGDIGAIKAALNILKSNNLMLIFPEGKRNNETIEHAKPGVALIANMAKVPVIPTYISGEYKFMHKITVKFGEPYYMTEYFDKKMSAEEIQTVADDILHTMRALKV